MSEGEPRYRLRIISDSLEEGAWSELAAALGLTPKDGHVDLAFDDYEELSHEVYDLLGPQGTLVLRWEASAPETPEGYSAPDDLWLQVDEIVEDLMGDWLKAEFRISLVTDENELTIEFKALLD